MTTTTPTKEEKIAAIINTDAPVKEAARTEETPSTAQEVAIVAAADDPGAAGDAASETATDDASTALAARMARFKALQAQKVAGRKATEREVREAEDRSARLAQISKLQDAHDKASYKLLKNDDPDFERKRNWDYTVEESESWDKRMAKKARNRDGVAFADYRNEANKVYKRQVKQMDKVDLEEYAAQKAQKLQRQVTSGQLQLVETPSGELYTVDTQGRINTPIEEEYNHDHKPTQEALDRLVAGIEKGEQARLKARAARGLRDQQDNGDVSYINQKNKQFNEKLSRFYNKYTSEIRDSFERGTAI